MIRGNKQVAAISIKDKTYYISTLLVDAKAIMKFNARQTYDDLDKPLQAKIREYIRKLVEEIEPLSTQIIEDELYMDCLSKKYREALKKYKEA